MELSFSQRIGMESVPEAPVANQLTDTLRNKLWNTLYDSLFGGITKCVQVTYRDDLSNVVLFRKIWSECLVWRLDEVPYDGADGVKRIKKFFFSAEWHTIFSFLEKFCKAVPKLENTLTEKLNAALESEFSAYRIVNSLVTEIHSEEERQEIIKAIKHSPYVAVQEHLAQALKHLSDRNNPDFRNSIKESISAVEAFCCKIVNNEKATLGQALKIIEQKHPLHPALRGAFDKLYGYTSDSSDGIRHNLLEESNLTQADARFMLITCSAFINYLIDLSRD